MAQNFFDQVQTAAVGTTYTAFSDRVADMARVHNANAVSVDVQKDAAGPAITIPALSFRTFYGINNMKQLAVRRTDTSNTQVNVQAEAIPFGV